MNIEDKEFELVSKSIDSLAESAVKNIYPKDMFATLMRSVVNDALFICKEIHMKEKYGEEL